VLANLAVLRAALPALRATQGRVVQLSSLIRASLQSRLAELGRWESFSPVHLGA
jgi:hypothetical protein